MGFFFFEVLEILSGLYWRATQKLPNNSLRGKHKIYNKFPPQWNSVSSFTELHCVNSKQNEQTLFVCQVKNMGKIK